MVVGFFNGIHMDRRKSRYSKQYDYYSCGPIALLNALKWAGCNYSVKKDLDRIKKECKLQDDGVFVNDFHSAVKKESKDIFIYKRYTKFTTDKMIKHLLKGGSILLNYRFVYEDYGEEIRHYTFIPQVKRNKFIAINNNIVNNKIKTVGTISYDRMKKMIKSYRKYKLSFPTAWFLTKDN
jgi:hypothetical protein